MGKAWRWRAGAWRIARAVLLLVVLAAGAAPVNGADWNKGFRDRFVRVEAPGHPPIELYANEAGRGETIVLLHGLGASSYTFRDLAPALARHYRVITVDLKGHGRSDKPFDRHYSPRDQAVLIYWFLRQEGLNRVTLAGHSLGGLVALNLAVLLQRYDRKRLRRLVLMSAPAYPQELTSAVSFLRKPVLPYVALTLVPRQIPIAIALMSEVVGLPQDVTSRDIWTYAEPFADAGARHALIETARQIVPRNAKEVIGKYAKVRQPTLLIWCRDDNVVPLETGRKLRRQLPRAKLRVLKGCNHVPPEQKPKEVLETLRRFMR